MTHSNWKLLNNFRAENIPKISVLGFVATEWSENLKIVFDFLWYSKFRMSIKDVLRSKFENT
jgi:hypothetical protein